MTRSRPGAAEADPDPVGGAARRRTANEVLAAAAVLLGLCLLVRAPINVIPPMLTSIGGELGMSEVLMGALTAVPVLCFGLLTPVGSAVVRRIGPNASALAFLAVLICGAALRSAGSTRTLFAGTILMGMGMSIANIVIPMIIGRDFAMRAALMTGLYTVSSNIGTSVVTAVAVPTAQVVGWQWSAFAWTAGPAALIGLAWVAVFPVRASKGSMPVSPAARPGANDRRSTPVWAMPTAWLLAGAFAGHTYAYYSFSGWLPTMLQDLRSMNEAQAGLATTVFHMVGVLGSLVPPLLSGRFKWKDSSVLALVSAMWLAMPLGLRIAPALWPLWSACCGIGHGALFTALFTTVIEHSPTIDVNRRVVAFVQSIGYLVATVGPISVGWMHEATGGWSLPFAVLIASLATMTICSQAACRGRIDLGGGR